MVNHSALAVVDFYLILSACQPKVYSFKFGAFGYLSEAEVMDTEANTITKTFGPPVGPPVGQGISY